MLTTPSEFTYDNRLFDESESTTMFNSGIVKITCWQGDGCYNKTERYLVHKSKNGFYFVVLEVYKKRFFNLWGKLERKNRWVRAIFANYPECLTWLRELKVLEGGNFEAPAIDAS